jgi:hypothetical protein
MLAFKLFLFIAVIAKLNGFNIHGYPKAVHTAFRGGLLVLLDGHYWTPGP